MQLYVDMDGVLADFDRHYQAVFGVPADKRADNVDWAAVRKTPDFYLHIPPMPDMRDLWTRVAPLHPIILTGVPASVPEAAANKRAWVRRYLGDDVGLICCRARDKSLYAKPGDILIDDWEKYRALWLAKRGIWITHHTAAKTSDELRKLGV